MRKIMAVSLMFLTVLTVTTQNAAASALSQSTLPVKFMPGAARQTSERLIAELERSQPNSVDDSLPPYKELVHSDSGTDLDASQTTPAKKQKASGPHNHHVRNLVIFGVVLGIGFFCLAASVK